MECRIFFRTEFSHLLIYLERFVHDKHSIVSLRPLFIVEIHSFSSSDRSVGDSICFGSMWRVEEEVEGISRDSTTDVRKLL